MELHYQLIASIGGSIAIFLFLIFRWQKEKDILKNCIQTEGVIIENEEKFDAQGNRYYHPKIKFQLVNKEWMVVKYSIGYNYPKREGTKLKVAYSLSDPNQIVVKAFSYQLTILLVTVGTVVLGYGLYLLYKIYLT